MARKSSSSIQRKEQVRSDLEREVGEAKSEIARIRNSEISRLDKTKRINILRKKLGGLQRDLDDLL